MSTGPLSPVVAQWSLSESARPLYIIIIIGMPMAKVVYPAKMYIVPAWGWCLSKSTKTLPPPLLLTCHYKAIRLSVKSLKVL